MGPVGFLLLAALISCVGSAVLYLRQRQPTSVEASIDSFRREMQALAPRVAPPDPGDAAEPVDPLRWKR